MNRDDAEQMLAHMLRTGQRSDRKKLRAQYAKELRSGNPAVRARAAAALRQLRQR